MQSVFYILIAAYASAALIGFGIILSRTKFHVREIWRFLQRESTKRLFQTIFAVFIFLILVFLFLTRAFPSIDEQDWAANNPSALVILLSGVLATIGWIFSIHAQERNLAKEHAYRLVERSTTDPVINEHKRNVMTAYPQGVRVNLEDLKVLKSELQDGGRYKKGKAPVLYSIYQILNVYENMAKGIRKDKLDEFIIKDFVGSILKASVTQKFREVILDHRKPDIDGIRPKSYEDIVWLIKRWHNIDLDDPHYGRGRS